MMLSLIALVLLATVVSSTPQDGKDLICSEDISTRASVLQCLSLLPLSHLEVIQQCNPDLVALGNDPIKMLDYFCQDSRDLREETRCAAEMYRSQGKSLEEDLQPALDCLRNVFQGK